MNVQNNRKEELNQRKKLFNKVHPDELVKSQATEDIKTKMMKQVQKIQALNEKKRGD